MKQSESKPTIEVAGVDADAKLIALLRETADALEKGGLEQLKSGCGKASFRVTGSAATLDLKQRS